MAFLDSVYWIAIKHQKDKWHQKAVALRAYVMSIDRIYITEGILIETGNFLLRKENATIAQQVLNDLEKKITESDNVHLEQIKKEIEVLKQVINDNKAELEQVIKKLSDMKDEQ